MADMFTCYVDTSNLMKAQRLFNRHSRTIPAEALNRTAYFIVQAAMNATPVTTTGKIDAELNVVTEQRISPRTGKPVSARTRNPTVVKIDSADFASRIVLARLRHAKMSDYNVLTDMKYALTTPQRFSPGAGVAGFWAKINEVAQRMVKSRHSSGAFFKSSWKAVLQQLAPFLPRGYRRTAKLSGPAVNPDLGSVTPAQPGGINAVCIIENRIGLDTMYPTINANRNLQAHRFLEPILQAKINAEFESKMEYAAKQGWLEDKEELAALGILVLP